MVPSTPNYGPSGGALTEVLELILDRGVVIDVFVRISLLGIEILTIEARIVVASVDTYLRYAEAVGRLNLERPKAGVPELVEAHATEKAIESVAEKLGLLFGGASSTPAEAKVIEARPREEEGD